VDFSRTKINLNRGLLSYTKAQKFASVLLRTTGIRKPYPSTPFYLDIGPGANINNEFFNVDYSWRPGVDACIDITKSFLLPEGIVSGIFTEHCLEHIEFEIVLSILEACHKGLATGAVLRVSMPDLAIYADRVAEANRGTPVLELPHQRERAGILTAATALNDVMRLHGHRFVWDYQTLSRALHSVGFSTVQRCSFRQGLDPMLLRDSASRAYESFYVEAVK